MSLINATAETVTASCFCTLWGVQIRRLVIGGVTRIAQNVTLLTEFRPHAANTLTIKITISVSV
jgi:hypothetical protein